MQFHQLHMHFTKCSYNAPLLITKAFGYILNTVSLNTVTSNCQIFGYSLTYIKKVHRNSTLTTCTKTQNLNAT